jgi:hypothetical protein
MSQRKSQVRKSRKGDKLSLAQLDFETAVRLTLATGKMPKAKRKPKKRKARK